MADSFFALADLVKVNDQNLADLDLTDILADVPFLRAMPAQLASNGTQHKYLKETTAPTVGFRAANAGRFLSHSADTLVTIDLAILDATFAIDKALCEQFQRGGSAALIARELRRHLRAGFKAAERQLIYGTGADSGGFSGLCNAATIDGLADAMVVNAGGSTALSSVYALRAPTDYSGSCVVVGGSTAGTEGQITVGETYESLMTDGDGKHYPALVTSVLGYLGLQLGNVYSVGRIANLDASTHMLNDDLIATLLSKFPADAWPTHFVMGTRSLADLQKSRTAVNPSGAPAPFPTEAFGIPIYATSSVGIAETAVS